MEELLDDIKNKKYRNIIIVSGAGVSTNSGKHLDLLMLT